MYRMLIRLAGAGLWVLLAACTAAPPPNRSGLSAATLVPTLDMTDAQTLCAAADRYWGHDWLLAIQALEGLRALAAHCGADFDLDNRLYLAYLGYGSALESRGRTDEAMVAYQQALSYNPRGSEAAVRLERLDVFTPIPPPRCQQAQVAAAYESLPLYTPTSGTYIRLTNNQLSEAEEPFFIYGVNYYPRDTPFDRFLTVDLDVQILQAEMALLSTAGINTLRIFMRYDALFTCIGNGAVPVPEVFMRLDAVIQAAAAAELRLIVVLNHQADLTTYPLYSSPRHVAAQSAFLAGRYAYEPTILAWDLRASGDVDYTNGVFTRERILNWLTQTAAVVRAAAPNHLITAGWNDDAAATLGVVDFISFQNFGTVDDLRTEIAALRSQTSLPILLAAAGADTFNNTEIEQLQLVERILEAAERNNLAGWALWMAFDYPLTATCSGDNCASAPTADNLFGLWNTSYFPKLAVNAVLDATGMRTSP